MLKPDLKHAYTTVARYWQDNFDLTYIIKRDWPKIGNSLKGKIHIYVGDMDTYYLNNAVYDAEDMLKKLDNPNYNCVIDYGDRANNAGTATIPSQITSAACVTTKCSSKNGPRKLLTVPLQEQTLNHGGISHSY